MILAEVVTEVPENNNKYDTISEDMERHEDENWLF